MKTIKPLRLGFLCRVFENDHKAYLATTILSFFPFESPGQLLPEVNLWKLVGAELGQNAALDECMPKSRGELIVNGKAYARGGTPVPATQVRVQLGSIDKTLYVFGDRRWNRLGVPTDPEPFVEMPVDWEHAFGGPGFAQNPLGKGFAKVSTEAGDAHPLPNVEHPKRIVKSPKDRPAPAGFGTFDVTWPQRASKAGTYDQKWLEERFPGFPKDMDWEFFNVAPPDQLLDGFFNGDETFVVENMHPDEPRLEGRLPGLVARCFANLKTPEGESFVEVPTRIDTVRLFPHKQRGIVVHRGVLPVREDDGADVLQIVVACEAPGEPKPIEHYRSVLAQRLDRSKAYLALRDSDLMPPKDPSAPPLGDDKLSDMEDLLASEGLLRKNARRGLEKVLEATKAEIRSLGLDPEPLVKDLPPEPAPVGLEELPAFIEQSMKEANEQRDAAAKQIAAAQEEARRTCAALGVDYDKAQRDAAAKHGGPPKFTAAGELERMRDMATLGRNAGVPLTDLEEKLADPALEAKLVALEKTLRDAYRRFAHHYPAAAELEAEAKAQLRDEIAKAVEAGESLAGRDLTGADLSGMALDGAELSGTMMEGADLSGATLRGAKLEKAVLTRARLSKADFGGAHLAGANLGAAKLDGATLAGADLTTAVLAKADLTGADATGAKLDKATLDEAILEGACLEGVSAIGLVLMKPALSGVRLARADLTKAAFLEGDLRGLDVSGAKLVSAVFLGVQADGAKLRGASLVNLRVVKESSFAGADFHGANLAGANLRGTNLAEADLGEANLDGADLSECNLCGAKLAGASAVSALFMKTDLTGADAHGANLMMGVLQRAKVHGASFEGANLFRADAAKMRGDKTTIFKDANMKQVRVVPVREPNEPG